MCLDFARRERWLVQLTKVGIGESEFFPNPTGISQSD